MARTSTAAHTDNLPLEVTVLHQSLTPPLAFMFGKGLISRSQNDYNNDTAVARVRLSLTYLLAQG